MSADVLTSWYIERAMEIEKYSGQVWEIYIPFMHTISTWHALYSQLMNLVASAFMKSSCDILHAD